MIKNIIITLSLIIPSVLFAGGYGYNNVRVIESYNVVQKQVQFDPRLFVEPSGFYQVGEKLKLEKEKNLEDEVKELRSQLEILIKILQAKNGNFPLPQPENPTTEPVPSPEEPKFGTDLDSKTFAIFKKSCGRCHGETKQDGGLQLVDGDALINLDLASRVLVHHRTNGVSLDSGEVRMPKGGTLSDDEVEILRLWAVEKAKSGE